MKQVLILGGGGYIGSRFYHEYYDKYQLTSIDLQLFGSDAYSIGINYNKLSDINNYNVILCFAGHSSVNMCEYSPDRSWTNNVEYFKNLCEKLNNDQTLIYMSSASIYGNSDIIAKEDDLINMHPIKNYDLQKILIDIIANKYISYHKNIIGLRLGTVNGASPHTRKELMLNSMVANAIDNKSINIKNLKMKRSILGISDLMRSISTIIDSRPISGQYNLCSFTMNVEQLGTTVADLCHAKINQNPSDDIFYSFEMSTEKFCKNYNFNFNATPQSIVKELVENHKYTRYTTRDNDANFQQFM
jgi:UDP-glucose 4-epimerase